MCSPRACASKPPCGSCWCSSSVVNFRCSVTRRFASAGAQAVTWLQSQCAWRVKHSQCNGLTDSLCVLSRFGSAQHLRSTSDAVLLRCDGQPRFISQYEETHAVSSGSLGDITLYHEPCDDVNSLLNLKTARHARKKIGVQRESLDIRQVPFHQASLGIFRNSCIWATVHLIKNEEQCQRVLQNVHTLDPNISLQLQSTLYGSSILCYVSVEDVNHVQNKDMSGEKRRIAYFVCDITGEQVVVRVDQLFTEAQKMCESPNTHLEQLKGRIIFMSMYNDVDWHQKRKEEVRKQYPLKGHGLFSDQEKKNNWYGSLSCKLHGRCNSVGADMMYIFAADALRYTSDRQSG